MSEQLEAVDTLQFPNEWITTTEAAELTGYSRENILRARERGLLSGVKRGTLLFYRATDVLEYAKRMSALGSQKHTPKKYLDEELVS